MGNLMFVAENHKPKESEMQQILGTCIDNIKTLSMMATLYQAANNLRAGVYSLSCEFVIYRIIYPEKSHRFSIFISVDLDEL